MFQGYGYILISFFTLNLSAMGYKTKQTVMVTEQILILLNDISVCVTYPCNSVSVLMIRVTNNSNSNSNSTDG